VHSAKLVTINSPTRVSGIVGDFFAIIFSKLLNAVAHLEIASSFPKWQKAGLI